MANRARDCSIHALVVLALGSMAMPQDPIIVLGRQGGVLVAPQRQSVKTPQRWFHGEAFAFGEEGPKLTVVLPMAVGERHWQDRRHWLGEVQRRYRRDGVRVLVLTNNDPGDAVAKEPFDVAQGAIFPEHPVLLVAPSGRVAWQGTMTAGVLGQIDSLLKGGEVTPAAREAAQFQMVSLSDLEDHQTPALAKQAKYLLDGSKTSPGGWALALYVALERELDLEKARKVASDACKHLAMDAPAVASFVSEALHVRPVDDQILQQALMAMTTVVHMSPDDPLVQCTYVRVLNRLGRDKGIARLIPRLTKLAKDRGDIALMVAEALADGKAARSFGPVAEKMLATAEGNYVDYARYMVALRCLEDEARAEEYARKACPSSGGLNNLTWYLCVEPPRRGRFDALALALAERMIAEGNMDNAEMDTSALALFRNGQIARAVELQRASVKAGGTGNYRLRLQRFEKAAQVLGVEIK